MASISGAAGLSSLTMILTSDSGIEWRAGFLRSGVLESCHWTRSASARLALRGKVCVGVCHGEPRVIIGVGFVVGAIVRDTLDHGLWIIPASECPLRVRPIAFRLAAVAWRSRGPVTVVEMTGRFWRFIWKVEIPKGINLVGGLDDPNDKIESKFAIRETG
jgi:hypothetical protein